MPTFDSDFQFILSALDQLESYLLTKDIYRPIGIRAPKGEPPYPQFTLGSLLLAKERAQVTAQSPVEKAQLTRKLNELEAIHSKWRSAWGSKASAEFRSRLKLWSDYLSEYRDEPEAHEDRYAYEISRRVMLELLQPDTIDLPSADEELLLVLDNMLRAVFAPGEFLWDDPLRMAFPKEDYWYLYGFLPRTPHKTTVA